LLTFFSIPKPFRDNYDIIQRNAIQSWLHAFPGCEVILCGNEEGVDNVATEYGAKHYPDVDCNEYGTPFLDSIFERIQVKAQYNLVCFVNCDIILLSGIRDAMNKIIVEYDRFLVVGQRWDFDISNLIDFKSQNWEDNLKEKVRTCGTLHDPVGSDYFIFPKGLLGKIPRFLIGRPGWDNWIIYQARTIGIPVIDGTELITVIHQNHDYAHVAKNIGGTYYGPEANYNLNLLGGKKRWFLLTDATFIFRHGELIKAQDAIHIRQKIMRQTVLYNNNFGLIWLLQIVCLIIFMFRTCLPKYVWRRLINAMCR